MKEERFFYVPDASEVDCLPDEEAVHAVRVLRLKEVMRYSFWTERDVSTRL